MIVYRCEYKIDWQLHEAANGQEYRPKLNLVPSSMSHNHNTFISIFHVPRNELRRAIRGLSASSSSDTPNTLTNNSVSILLQLIFYLVFVGALTSY
jgi:hypothetical protein